MSELRTLRYGPEAHTLIQIISLTALNASKNILKWGKSVLYTPHRRRKWPNGYGKRLNGQT